MRREDLAGTFNAAASRYHRARPDYPSALFDALVGAAGVSPGDAVLEIGPATGKATIPLALRGLSVTAVEPGPDLARELRANTRGLPVTVWNGRFEDFAPGSADESLALVAAATAWHWLDPEVRFQKAWSLLRPGGHLAFWGAWHVIPEGGDSFFQDIQDVYDEIGEGLPGTYQWLKPGEVPDETAAIRASGLFHPVLVQQFDWETIYSADQYIELLETFSGHLVMSGAQKERLYGAIRDRAGARPDPRIRRHWGAVLHVARRVG